MWNYSDTVKEHFFHPRNAKVVADANAVGEVGSISCGDALKLMLKVNPETEIIEDAGFQTFGCGSAIASSSALTELVIGKSLNDAASLTNQQIADYLGGLPPEKMHCSVMGMEALQAAIARYRGEEIAEDHEEGELICRCFGIDSALIEKVVMQNRLTTLEQVTAYTKAGGACATCHEKIEAKLVELVARMPLPEDAEPAPVVAEADAAPRPRSMLSRIRTIEAVIGEMRPIFQRDGGDITLVDVEGDMVFVQLKGACHGCGMSFATLSALEQRLSEALAEPISVFPTQAKSA